jgi:hypothetical protein
MEGNATTYLYNVTPNIERHNEIEMETNLVESTLTTMEKMFIANKCNHNIYCNFELYIC